MSKDVKKVFDLLKADAIKSLCREVLRGNTPAIRLALELSGDLENRPETTDFEFEVIGSDYKKNENN